MLKVNSCTAQGSVSTDVCAQSQSCPTLCNPLDCRPPRSSVHGILQTRILEWVAMPSSRGSSHPRHRTQVSCVAGGFFYRVRHHREAQSPQSLSLISAEADGKCTCCSLIGNAIGTCQLVTDKHQHHLRAPGQSQFSSVELSCSVVSESLRPHGLQHARPPPQTPRVYSNSCPLS